MEILNHKILGEGKPKKLVILHGLFGMLDNWVSLGKRFAEFFEVHLIDQRNHGRSFHHPVHNYQEMAQDLVNYLDAKDLDQVYLLGHSMGGKTVMQVACSFPERIEKLIVVDIAPKYYPPHHQVILQGLNAVETSQITSRKQADEVLSNFFDNQAIRMFLLKSLYRKEDKTYGFRFNLPTLEAQIESIGGSSDISCVFDKPTMFVDGALSNYILEEDHDLIEEHFPDNEIVEIPNAGHWVHAEQADLFWEKVMHFIQYS